MKSKKKIIEANRVYVWLWQHNHTLYKHKFLFLFGVNVTINIITFVRPFYLFTAWRIWPFPRSIDIHYLIFELSTILLYKIKFLSLLLVHIKHLPLCFRFDDRNHLYGRLLALICLYKCSTEYTPYHLKFTWKTILRII